MDYVLKNKHSNTGEWTIEQPTAREAKKRGRQSISKRKQIYNPIGEETTMPVKGLSHGICKAILKGTGKICLGSFKITSGLVWRCVKCGKNRKNTGK